MRDQCRSAQGGVFRGGKGPDIHAGVVFREKQCFLTSRMFRLIRRQSDILAYQEHQNGKYMATRLLLHRLTPNSKHQVAISQKPNQPSQPHCPCLRFLPIRPCVNESLREWGSRGVQERGIRLNNEVIRKRDWGIGFCNCSTSYGESPERILIFLGGEHPGLAHTPLTNLGGR